MWRRWRTSPPRASSADRRRGGRGAASGCARYWLKRGARFARKALTASSWSGPRLASAIAARLSLDGRVPGQVAVVLERPLDQHGDARRAVGDLGGERDGGGQEFVGRVEAVDEAHRQGLVGADPAAREAQFVGPAQTHDRRQQRGGGPLRHEAHAHEAHRHARARGGDAHRAGQRDAQPHADGESVEGDDDGLGAPHRLDPPQRDRVVVALGEFGEVGAGAEGAAPRR